MQSLFFFYILVASPPLFYFSRWGGRLFAVFFYPCICGGDLSLTLSLVLLLLVNVPPTSYSCPSSMQFFFDHRPVQFIEPPLPSSAIYSAIWTSEKCHRPVNYHSISVPWKVVHTLNCAQKMWWRGVIVIGILVIASVNCVRNAAGWLSWLYSFHWFLGNHFKKLNNLFKK